MTKNDPLFTLIHSLTHSEKRYFKVDTQFTKGEKKYLLLFDAIAAQKHYDEPALRESLKGEKLLNELHVAKKYLFDLILKSLGKYFGNRPYQTVLQYMKEIDVLTRKGLQPLALKRIEKVKRLTEQYQFLPLRLQIAQKEQIIHIGTTTGAAKAASLKKEIEYLLDQITRKTIYDSIYYTSVEALHVTSARKNDIVKLGKKIEALQKEFHGKKSDPLIKILFNRMNFNYYLIIDKPQKALPYITSSIAILDENQHIVREGYLNQLTQIYDYFACLHLLSFKPAEEFYDHAYFASFIKKIEATARLFTDEDRQIRSIKTILGIECIWTIFMGEYAMGLKLLNEGRKKLLHKKSPIDPLSALALNFYFMRCYFGTGEYSSALECANDILSSEAVQKNRPMVLCTKVIALTVFYELGEYAYIQQQLKVLARYFNKEQHFPRYQSLVLQSLKALLASKKNTNKQETLKALVAEFRDLRKSNTEALIFREFEFDWWLEAKVTNTSYAEVVKKHRSVESRN